jgi:hypothetical protein
MTKILYILTQLSCNLGFAQKISYSLQSNLIAHRYNGAAAKSHISMSWSPYRDLFTELESNWGAKAATSYDLDIAATLKLKNNIVLKIGLQYEVLNSKAIIDTFETSALFCNTKQVKGIAQTKNNLIALNPQVGKQINFNGLQIQVLAGVQLAHATSFLLNASLLQNNSETSTIKNRKIDQPFLTARSSVALNVFYKKLGFHLEHQQGFTNITNDNNYKAFNSIFKTGLIYTFRK